MALKDDRVEQCLRSCGNELPMWDTKQEKVRLYCWIFSMRVSEEERSVQDEVYRHVVVHKVSGTRTIYSTEAHTISLIFNTL